MARYAKPIPVDKLGNPLTENQVQVKANTTIVSENATVSSVVTLNDNTTDLEIASTGVPVFIKWISRTDTTASVISAAGTANYDHVIPPNWIRKFTVPVEQLGTSSLVGANIGNGLYNRVAWKTGGIGSILATQY